MPLGQIKQSNSRKWGCRLRINDHTALFSDFLLFSNDHSSSFLKQPIKVGLRGEREEKGLWLNQGKTPRAMPLRISYILSRREMSSLLPRCGIPFQLEPFPSAKVVKLQRASESPGGLVKHRELVLPPEFLTE